jgi:hypothetical protein
MRTSSAALACPASDSSGSGALMASFSACRITITTVEFAVNHTQSAKTAKTATPKAAIAPMAVSHMGIKNGPR